jgi:diguanylate cyclase (GGDEF)-like protein/PAS domain S-box-containing protein
VHAIAEIGNQNVALNAAPGNSGGYGMVVEAMTLLDHRPDGDALQAVKAELAAVKESAPFGLCRLNRHGECITVNAMLEKMAGLQKEKILGKRWRRRIHPEDRFGLLHELANWRSDGAQPSNPVCRLMRPDGSAIWISIRALPVIIDGQIDGYVASVDDITERRINETALLKSEQRLRLIADNIPALIAYVLPDERVASANHRYEEAYGVLHEELCGMYTWEVLGQDVYQKSRRYIHDALAGKPAHFEREVIQDGKVRFERVRYIPEFDLEGKVAGYFGLVEDITELKLVEAQLRKLVRHDSLTGLANRLQFEEKLGDAIRYSRRHQTLMAVMFLDIDHFKTINDTFGHQVGDEVLCEFGKRLLACVRQTDTVARLAGDEFVIILEGLSAQDEACGVARKIIAVMNADFKTSSGLRKITTSVGIAVRQEAEEDAQMLLHRADDAMYQAKSAGRNTFVCLA